jgi:hypothetical protein
MPTESGGVPHQLDTGTPNAFVARGWRCRNADSEAQIMANQNQKWPGAGSADSNQWQNPGALGIGTQARPMTVGPEMTVHEYQLKRIRELEQQLNDVLMLLPKRVRRYWERQQVKA